MTSISSLSSSAGAWPTTSRERTGPPREDFFKKVDSDGSGSVDQAELGTMLDKLSKRSGQDLGSAEDRMSSFDADGNGTLDDSELKQGLQSLMPPPASTMDFVQRQGGCEGGPPPPPPMDGESASTIDSLLQQLAQAVDSDGDQTLSDDELQQFGQTLQAALKAGTEDSSSSDATAGSDSSSASTDAQRLTQLLQRLLETYDQAASAGTGNADSDGSITINVSA